MIEAILCSILIVTTIICIFLGVILATGIYNFENLHLIGFGVIQVILPSPTTNSTTEPPTTLNPTTEAPTTTPEPTEICETPKCNRTALRLLYNMDSTVDPCENFYDFACGNFLKNTELPPTKDFQDSLSTVNDEFKQKIRDLLEDEAFQNPDVPRHQKLVVDYYKGCMNKNLIDELEDGPLLKLLNDLGGWPVLESEWDEDNFEWSKSVIESQKAGIVENYFIDFSLVLDKIKSSTLILQVDEPKYIMEKSAFGKNRLLNAYLTYMVDVATSLGADREEAVTELKESLEFEKRLALFDHSSEDTTDSSEPISMEKFQETYSSFDWKTFFNNILTPHAEIEDDDMIIDKKKNYVSAFIGVMTNSTKREQANYVMWRVVASLIPQLSGRVREAKRKFMKVYNRYYRDKEDWEECVDMVIASFGLAIRSMYVKSHFNETLKNHAMDIANNIRDQFMEILKKSEWMDEKTRETALDKASNMGMHIGYPPEFLDDDKLSEFYADLELPADDFMKSHMKITRFGMDFAFKRFRLPYNKSDWIFDGNTIKENEFYAHRENILRLPAEFLQDMFFHSDRPQYVNYGAIGFYLAHSITHGFDSRGSKYDKEGNLEEWWEGPTKTNYNKKETCFLNQYNDYKMEEVNMEISGDKTQNENIADHGGLKTAYYAYINWVRNNGGEFKLPNLNYTQNQLFWLSFASVQCAVYSDEYLRSMITAGPTSPGRFRVIGSISNMKEFAKDFNCPSGSEMAPIDKCSVW